MQSKEILKKFIQQALNEASEASDAGRPRSRPNTPLARKIDQAGGTTAVAERTGLSVSHLNRLARGIGYPSFETMQRIAAVTNDTMAAALNLFKKNKIS